MTTKITFETWHGEEYDDAGYIIGHNEIKHHEKTITHETDDELIEFIANYVDTENAYNIRTEEK